MKSGTFFGDSVYNIIAENYQYCKKPQQPYTTQPLCLCTNSQHFTQLCSMPELNNNNDNDTNNSLTYIAPVCQINFKGTGFSKRITYTVSGIKLIR